MKRKTIIGLLIACLLSAFIWCLRAQAENGKIGGRYEYATIRWGGRDNTHIIRPNGQVEFIGPEIRKVARPDRADERSFYMNVAMNGLAKEGYEFAGMTPDEIVMKREVIH